MGRVLGLAGIDGMGGGDQAEQLLDLGGRRHDLEARGTGLGGVPAFDDALAFSRLLAEFERRMTVYVLAAAACWRRRAARPLAQGTQLRRPDITPR